MAVTDQVWCKEGTAEMADAIWKDDATPEDKKICLFSDDETVDNDTVYADLTVIDANGLSPQTLTKANWTAATEADPSVSVYNSGTGVHWDVTGEQIVYGWAIVGVTSGKVYNAKNWGLKTFQNAEDLDINPLQIKYNMPLPA